MKRKPKAYRRDKRKEQVLNKLREWYETDYAKQATSYKLAKALDLEPTQHFRDILNEMVEAGDLLVVEAQPSGRFPTKFYLLATSPLITEKSYRRTITFKKRGFVVEQWEMFS